jgi:hypothetical protein
MLSVGAGRALALIFPSGFSKMENRLGTMDQEFF